MTFIVRLLSGVVFLLALSVGILLYFHMSILPPGMTNEVNTQQKTSTLRGLPSLSLSRLALFPWQPKQRELIAVMIENHEAARPHHMGLEKAVLVQEYFVEGFISRFVVLFNTRDLPEHIGPVRSLRPYFIQALLPWTKIVIHSGGSPEALERVENHTDVQNFNAIYLGDEYFTRDHEIPAPHNLFVSGASATSLLASADEQYHVLTQLPLYPVGRAAAGSGALTVDVDFYNPLHDIHYTFDSSKRVYTRLNGRTVSLATPANLVFLEMPAEVVGPYGRLSIDSLGSGRALFFRSGRVYSGTWARASESDPFALSNAEGDPMVFAGGQIWMTSVNDLERVTWEQ